MHQVLRGCAPVDLPPITLPTLARHLPGRGVEAIEEVGGGDHQDESCQALFIVVAGGLFPDLVGNGISLVSETRGGLSERERGAFSLCEVGRLPPGRYGEEPLICFTSFFGAARAIVDTVATAINLARAQMDQLKRFLWHSTLASGLEQGLDGLQDVRKDGRRIAHSCLHDESILL